MKKNFNQLLIGTLLTIPMLAQTQDGLFISELTDPLDDYTGRFIELFNAGTEDVDFSTVTLFLSRQSNGGTSWGDIQLTGLVPVGETFVIGGSSFESVYGFPPDLETGILTGNGDDAYFLYLDGDHSTGTLLDIFGEIDTDGTGTAWEYEDSRALRMETVSAPNAAWTASEWVISTAAISDCDPGTHYNAGSGGGDPEPGSYSLAVLNDTVVEGQLVEISIWCAELTSADHIISYQFDLNYDPSVLDYFGVELGNTIAETGSVIVNSAVSGKLSVSYMNTVAVTGSGSVVVLQFNSLIPDTTELILSNAFLNNTPVMDLGSGIAIVKGATPPSAAVTFSDTVNRYADTLVIMANFSAAMDPATDVLINLSGAVTLANAPMIRQSQTVYSYEFPVPKAAGEVTVSLANGTDLWGNELVPVPYSGSMFSIIGFTPGDVDDDGIILAYDAALTLQHSVGLDPLPEADPLPWENWRDSTANVDGTGGITANDAGMILQYSAGIISDFSGTAKKALSTADVLVRLEENEIVFYSQGELLGLNIWTDNDIKSLGRPVFLNEKLMNAFNIGDQCYNIGMCTAYSPPDGTAILKIPVIKGGKITFNMLVNTEEKQVVVDLATGFTGAADERIFIYPNPAKEYVCIQSRRDATTAYQRIRIINQLGRTLFEEKLEEADCRINLVGLKSSGLHFLQVIDANGEVVTMRKIIFQ